MSMLRPSQENYGGKFSGKPKKKRLRTSQACDFCSRRSIKCSRGQENSSQCQNCIDFDVPCTYNRPIKKRGQKRQKPPVKQETPATTPQLSLLDMKTSNWPEESEEALGRAWKAFALVAQPAISDLVAIYFDVVYPIFPWFHRPTLTERLARHDHLQDRAFFSSVMGACALAAARARDGACQSPRQLDHPSAETFFEACKQAVPKELHKARGIDFLRACALLALTSVQNGQVDEMHQYVGMYHTISALEGFYDEGNWPKCSEVEMEERRCLFWSFYTFEVYSSVTWGGIVRNRESQAQVRYTKWNDDQGDFRHSRHGGNYWLRGWNFTTDLYRILEHALDFLQAGKIQLKPQLTLYQSRPPNAAVLQQVQHMYQELPQEFKIRTHVNEATSNVYGIQAVNIFATLALVRIVIFASEPHATVDQKCDIAEELLMGLGQTDVTYMKAVSSPLLHLLAAIGAILSCGLELALSESAHVRVKGVLLRIANLLETLESDMQQGGKASFKVRAQIEKIDALALPQSTSRDAAPSIPVLQSMPPPTTFSSQLRPPIATIAPRLNEGTDGQVIRSGFMEATMWQYPPDFLEGPWSINGTPNDDM